MGELISLEEKKIEDQPHASGIAICLDCKYEWVAIAPLITTWLECPSCSLIRGRLKVYFERDGLQWECGCGNDLFFIKPEGCYCPNCGKWAQLPE